MYSLKVEDRHLVPPLKKGARGIFKYCGDIDEIPPTPLFNIDNCHLPLIWRKLVLLREVRQLGIRNKKAEEFQRLEAKTLDS
ncbi:MAG: hypothetical protein QNJ97_21795, partial [Myxococcota bacterium]|nr:hypothetical protein [Myxococcota bacterium]